MPRRAAASPPWPPRAGSSGPRPLPREKSRPITAMAAPGGERGQCARPSSRRSASTATARPGDRVPTLLLKAIELEHYRGQMRKDKILRHPGGLPDYPKNSVRPESPRCTTRIQSGALITIRCSRPRLCGPERRAVHLHAPVLRAAVRQSYSVAVRWRAGIPPTGTPPTTAPTPPRRPSELVKEVLIQVAGDPAIDLAQFDQEDRYDPNGNGKLQRAGTGLIDHLMIFTPASARRAGWWRSGEDAIWGLSLESGRPPPHPRHQQPEPELGGQFAAYDYTIQPIDVAAVGSVPTNMATIQAAGRVRQWAPARGNRWRPGPIMSLRPWAGVIGAPSRPGSPPGPRSSRRPPSAATGCTAATCSSPIQPRGNVYMLIRPTTRRNDDVVRINLPAKQIPLNPPYAGQYQYHGGKGNNLDNRMSLKLI